MRVISYTDSRANYAQVLESVVNDCEEVVITRAGHDPVVMVSLAEYESLKETAYLLRSPANARTLHERLARFEQGHGSTHDLIED